MLNRNLHCYCFVGDVKVPFGMAAEQSTESRYSDCPVAVKQLYDDASVLISAAFIFTDSNGLDGGTLCESLQIPSQNYRTAY